MSTYWKTEYPDFSADVPLARIERISLQKLLSGDETESRRVYEACRDLGFFQLDLRDSPEGKAVLKDVAEAYDIAEPLFNLPDSIKANFGLQDGTAFGHKAYGITKVDSRGTPDRCEFWGVSKDTTMGVADREARPDILKDNNALLQSLNKSSHALCMYIISHLETHLQIPKGKLSGLHDITRTSNDQFRYMFMPPQPEGDRRCSFLPHTDFGSVTLVWNVLGGLQIQKSGATNLDEDWQFIKPEKGCAVVNMGDSMVKLTNNVIKSCLHRVAYAPGEQAFLNRYSLGYFSRPYEDAVMNGLCQVEDEMWEAHPEAEDKVYTMGDWVAERIEVYKKGGGQMRSWGGTAKLVTA